MIRIIKKLPTVLLVVCAGVLTFACDDSTGDSDSGNASAVDANGQSREERDAAMEAAIDSAIEAAMDGAKNTPKGTAKDAAMDGAKNAPKSAAKDAATDASKGTAKDAAMDPVCERTVLEGEVTNARDMGGWPLADGKHTACHRLLRGGTLATLSKAGCAEFVALGIRTVVDLRESSLQAVTPAADCVLSNATHISAAMPKLLPDTPENYLALWNQAEAVRKAFDAMGDKAAYPVYFHCESGRDRTSFIAALALLALGANRQTVVEDFELSNPAGVAVKSECIEAVVDEVEKRGGINKVLEEFGVSQSQVNVLREQMVAK